MIFINRVVYPIALFKLNGKIIMIIYLWYLEQKQWR